MTTLFRLLRVKHYVKNFFIFLPLFFGLEMDNLDKLIAVLLSYVFFSLVASAVYVVNDWRDLDMDRRHPVKRFRPIAAGLVSVPKALGIAAGIAIFGLAGACAVNPNTFAVIFLYALMNMCYSFYLKHVALLDITIIALGFALRLFVGATASGVPLSIWIIAMTFLLALFLALAKRRDDVLIYQETGEKMRGVVDGYNLEFVNAAMVVMAAVVIVFYGLYTVSADVVAKVGSENLYLTLFFVVIGILRYMQLTFVYGRSGNPTEALLTDRFLQAVIIGWLGGFAYILYWATF